MQYTQYITPMLMLLFVCDLAYICNIVKYFMYFMPQRIDREQSRGGKRQMVNIASEHKPVSMFLIRT